MRSIGPLDARVLASDLVRVRRESGRGDGKKTDRSRGAAPRIEHRSGSVWSSSSRNDLAHAVSFHAGLRQRINCDLTGPALEVS